MKRKATVPSVVLQLESQGTQSGELEPAKRQRQSVPLKADNVTKTLMSVTITKENWQDKWQWCGREILCLSHSKLNRLTTLCSTDETACYQEIVSYWLENHPYASWRELINQFESKNQHKLAEKIRGDAEPLTDPTLTLKNVKRVLKSLKLFTIEICLQLPRSVCKDIKQLKESDDKKRERLISYWLTSSPFANWEALAGRLYYRKETEALEMAKMFVQRVPEPTLTITNLCIVWKDLKSSKTHGFPWLILNIPQSAIDEVEARHPNDLVQQSKALCKHFLDHNPAPSWEKLAYMLYLQAFYSNCYQALEVIQSSYLKGTSEMRRLFKESMVFGHIVSKIVKVLLIGGPGVGKTSTKAIILCQDPPDIYISTPLAMRAVKVYRVNSSDPKEWVELSRKDRNHLLSKAFQCCSLNSIADLPKYCSLADHHQKMEEERKTFQLEQQVPSPLVLTPPTSDEESSIADPTETAFTDQQLMETSTADELITLLDNPSLGEPVERISRVQITDSGGQPQFTELLPVFVKGTSLYLFVQKLSEKLSTCGLVEYVDKRGENVCEPYRASQSNLQIFQHCVRILLSQRIKKNGDNSIPHLMVIGSFKDKAEDCEESIGDKEKTLQELLLPKFEEKIVYSDIIPKRLIFPLNARNPGKEEKEVAEEIRQLISKIQKRSVPSVEIPLQWYALESLLDKLSEKFGRDVLSRQECLSESKKLLFEQDSFNAALLFFEGLNVIYYYPQLLPEVVFSNTQVLLDKVTELVELIHRLRSNDKPKACDRSWQRFHDYALVSVEFLSKYCKKHYVDGLFTATELVQLFSGLSVFAKFNDDEYFVPALLRTLTAQEVAENRVMGPSAIPAMVLIFANDGPCLGVFCAMIVSLLSQQNSHPCAWQLDMGRDSITPICLYRNCVKFVIPKSESHSNGRKSKYPGTVVLIDAFTHFEVHLDLPECASNLATQMCSLIRHAVFKAIHQANLALHYDIPEPSVDALCVCGVGESHAAEIDKKNNYLLCSRDTHKCKKLQSRQLLWCEEDKTESVSMEQSQSAVPSSDIKLDASPRACQLQCIKKNGHTLRLIKKVAPNWVELAIALEFESHSISLIEQDHHQQAEKACRKMLFEWLEGKARQPVTWKTLIAALQDVELTSIAETLKAIFCNT